MNTGIALVVLRFELVEWSKGLDIFYCAPEFELTMERPTEQEKQKYNDSDEMRGCRQINELAIETLTFKEESEMMDVEGAAGSSGSTPRSPRTTGVVRRQRSARSTSQGDGQEGCSYAAAVSGRSFRPVSAESRGSPESTGEVTHKRGRPKSATPKPPSTLEFYCGNPSVERVQGVLHLFKDSKKTPMDDDASRSELVCMLSVPASFTVHDLLLFTDHVYEGIEYMKIIRDVSPNYYMVLIKFKTQRLADEFYRNYNNTPFNSIEDHVCRLVYVARVDFLKESEGGAVPIPGLVELPSCPVCLERMDESVDGILTILCNHTFHGHCLEKWGDTSCPVCRYSQTPEEVGENHCFECESTESLWICLICGQVGCGRYADGHAYNHFERTNHNYAMQLSNGHVWDYVGDNWVHRLVQNKEDGKLVEMDERGHRDSDKKMDSLTLEYTYLLTSQLESQRRYFEERIAAVELECAEKLAKSEEEFNSVVRSKSLDSQEIQQLLKSKEQAEKKCEQLSTQLRKVLKQLQEEQALNKSLLSNQQEWQEKIKRLECEKLYQQQELKETQDQLRDILFHLDAQEKLTADNSGVEQQELEDSQISVGAAAKPTTRRLKKKR